MRYQKSASGQLAFKQRSSEISARQRSLFLLFDGNRSVGEVLATTSGLGITQADVDDLIAKGFLARADGTSPDLPNPIPSANAGASLMLPSTPLAASIPTLVDVDSSKSTAELDQQVVYRQAYPVATKLTASLGLRGFRLNLAVEAASGYQDLVALLPQITQAVGPTAAQELKKALRLN